ncbi:MAG: NADPH-dependent F420 reductase [Isosphaeraceae bacterium]
MKVGIVGTGRVAEALGGAWADRGHDLRIAGREPGRAAELAAKLGRGAKSCSTAELFAEAQVILLAIPWSSVHDVLREAGDLAGRVLIDCINPLHPNNFTELADLGDASSTADQIQRWSPGVKVVKAFNTVSAATMKAPRFGDHHATLPFCGDDPEAKALVGRLIADAGFDPLDVGGVEEASLLESMALLVIRLAARRRMGADLGWKLLRRDPAAG